MCIHACVLACGRHVIDCLQFPLSSSMVSCQSVRVVSFSGITSIMYRNVTQAVNLFVHCPIHDISHSLGLP